MIFRMLRWIARSIYNCELVPRLPPPESATIAYLVWIRVDGTRTTLKIDPNVKSDPGLISVGRDVEAELMRIFYSRRGSNDC
jgi:hypothetical protein